MCVVSVRELQRRGTGTKLPQNRIIRRKELNKQADGAYGSMNH